MKYEIENQGMATVTVFDSKLQPIILKVGEKTIIDRKVEDCGIKILRKIEKKISKED